MKKIILSLIIVFILLGVGYQFYASKINKPKKEFYKPLSPKDLNPKSFIELFKKEYNKDSKMNSVTLMGDFPENWVKPNDIEYLISIMKSKEKCCGYMNTYSSFISSENGEVGGFAVIFLNSYISKTKINMGLNCNPKTDEESVTKIESWYRNTKN